MVIIKNFFFFHFPTSLNILSDNPYGSILKETRCTSLDKLRKLRKENNNLNIERATQTLLRTITVIITIKNDVKCEYVSATCFAARANHEYGLLECFIEMVASKVIDVVNNVYCGISLSL